MKKFGKLAVLAAMVLALACFVSCDNPAGGGGKVLATYKSTGEKAEICMASLDGPIFYYFKENDVFSTTVTHGGKTYEFLKGTYTGDATKDGDVTITIKDYADIVYIGVMGKQDWTGESASAVTVTIADGKGEFPVYVYEGEVVKTMGCYAEMARQ